MVKVVGVRFRTAGKIYFFDPVQFEIKRGDKVIVETARGIEFGTVVSEVRELEEEAVVQPLKQILRIATQRDKEQEAGNKKKEQEAFRICLEKIRKHGLEMKLIDAEYTFDNNKVLFYFTADGRIDFRELVKDLAGVFKTRIELRQIGVRDETKIMGGIGICGRVLCCHSYLSDFNAVSIKMAKEQNLSLNPTKISGVCGRLMCCLKNEEETYEELNRRLPNVGDTVTTSDGQKGEVQSVNVLRQLVKVLVEVGDAKELKEFEVDKLRFQKRRGKKDKQEITPEEELELERLEQEEEEEQELEAALEEDAPQERRGGQGRRRNQEKKDRRGQEGQPEGGKHHDRKEHQNRKEKQNNSQERQGTGQPVQAAGPAENAPADAAERKGQTDGGKRQDRRDRQNRNEGGRRNRQDRNRKGENGGNNAGNAQAASGEGQSRDKDTEKSGNRRENDNKRSGQEKENRHSGNRQRFRNRNKNKSSENQSGSAGNQE